MYISSVVSLSNNYFTFTSTKLLNCLSVHMLLFCKVRECNSTKYFDFNFLGSWYPYLRSSVSRRYFRY